MTEEAKVIAARDNGEAQQWGRNRLYFRDGMKWTLRSKTISLVAGSIFLTICIFQSELDPNQEAPLPNPVVTAEALSEALVKIESYVKAKSPEPKPVRPKNSQVTLTGPQVILRPRNIKIPPGTTSNARLLNGATDGLVRAELTEALFFNGENLMEEGAVLIGQGNSTEDRLLVTFNRAVFRDGTTIPIHAQACDFSDRIVGLKGSKLGNTAVNIAGSIGLGLVGGFSEGLQDTHGHQGVTVRPPSLRNALLNATATTALEQSRNLMSDLKDRRPVIEVPVGQSICVIFDAN